MDDYSSFKTVDPSEISTTKTKTGVRRGGTARELQMARAMGQQVPFTPAAQPEDSSGASFMTGVGRSASLGTSDYLAALALMGTRSATGGAPITFQDALADVRTMNEQLREQSPIAYGAGQVVGSLGGPGAVAMQAVKRAPALGTIAGMTGTGAVTGGISGFTENEDLAQAAAGAGLGALTGGTVGAAFQGTKRLIDKAARESAARSVEKLLTSKQAGNREALENLFGRTDKEFRNEGTTVFKEGKNLVDALRRGDLTARSIPEFVQVARQLEQKSFPEHLINIGESGLRGGAGAGVGLGLSALSGGVIPPGLAMAGIGLYGAKEAGGRMVIDAARTGISKLATQEYFPLMQEVTKRGPRMAPIDDTAAKLAGTYQRPKVSTVIEPTPSRIGAGITATVAPQMTPSMPSDYSEFTPVEESLTPISTPQPAGSRLQQLAEQFRQRFGGQ